MDKQEIRAMIRAQKRTMSPEQIGRASAHLTRLFLRSPQYRNAKSIYGYLPFNQEVDTTPILMQALRDGKKVALPKIYGTEMRFVWVTDLTAVQKAGLGCPEPIADAPIADDPDALVLLPGLAFDLRGGRMGYGGGFYDAFLSAFDGSSIGLCRRAQFRHRRGDSSRQCRRRLCGCAAFRGGEAL